jgi:hypothetical protein
LRQGVTATHDPTVCGTYQRGPTTTALHRGVSLRHQRLPYGTV